jgi:hypothetical protein
MGSKRGTGSHSITQNKDVKYIQKSKATSILRQQRWMVQRKIQKQMRNGEINNESRSSMSGKIQIKSDNSMTHIDDNKIPRTHHKPSLPDQSNVATTFVSNLDKNRRLKDSTPRRKPPKNHQHRPPHTNKKKQTAPSVKCNSSKSSPCTNYCSAARSSALLTTAGAAGCVSGEAWLFPARQLGGQRRRRRRKKRDLLVGHHRCFVGAARPRARCPAGDGRGRCGIDA